MGRGEVSIENFLEDSEPKEPLTNAKNYIKSYFRAAIINKDCKPDTTFSEEVNECLKICYDIRKDDVFQFIAKENVLKMGHNIVESFDWKLKWILGSSDLATIKEPVLQVDLYCVCLEADNLKRNIVNFEANLEKVDELINELTKIKKELDSS